MLQKSGENMGGNELGTVRFLLSFPSVFCPTVTSAIVTTADSFKKKHFLL